MIKFQNSQLNWDKSIMKKISLIGKIRVSKSNRINILIYGRYILYGYSLIFMINIFLLLYN